MNVNFVKTKTVSDTQYVDLVLIDGKPHTFLMKNSGKTQEGMNVFEVEDKKEGDFFNEFVEKRQTTSV